MFVRSYPLREALVIKHIVLWKLKDGSLGATKSENIERVKREVAALMGVVPGLRAIEAGGNFDSSDGAWDVALYSEFDSREALEAYQVHPRHEALKDFLAEVREDRAFVDYEV
jgi:hypothetical protein